MSFFNYLLISVLLTPNNSDFDLRFGEKENCASLQISYDVTPTEIGKFDVAVTSKSGVNPIQYLFYSDEGKVLSIDVNKKTLKGISKGKYYCIVRDAKNCRETIVIEIK
jgi:hypothetical protein